MLPQISAVVALRRRNAAGPLVVVVASSLLAACASTTGGGSGVGQRFFTGPASSGGTSQEYDPDFFLKKGYCPPIEIRSGTEALVAYERKHEGEPNFVTHQGSITRTARECATVAGTMTIKVGVAGRVVAGPKGGEGTVVLPLRVAVVKQHGGNVLYTQEFKVSASLTPPEFGADFTQVFDQVAFNISPDDRDLTVYVGFDQGKPPTTAGR